VFNFLKHIDQNKSNEGQSSISNTTIEKFLQLLKQKQSLGCLINLMNILREYKENQRPVKHVRKLSQDRFTSEFDPQFDLEVDGHMIKKFVFYFGSKVNILSKETWIHLEIPLMQPIMNYLKLEDQIFIEPIGTVKSFITSIMGIPTRVNFEVIIPVEGIPSYLALV
jgi:hypothetical protein